MGSATGRAVLEYNLAPSGRLSFQCAVNRVQDASFTATVVPNVRIARDDSLFGTRSSRVSGHNTSS